MRQIIDTKTVYCPHCKKEHIVDFISDSCYVSITDNYGVIHTQQYTGYFFYCEEANEYFETDVLYAKNLSAKEVVVKALKEKLNVSTRLFSKKT